VGITDRLGNRLLLVVRWQCRLTAPVLRLELFARIVAVLTDQRFGDIISQKTMSSPIRLLVSKARHDKSATMHWRLPR
jgi:hypothetical protein